MSSEPQRPRRAVVELNPGEILLEIKADVGAARADIENIKNTLDDYGPRIRDVEKKQWTRTGMITVIGVLFLEALSWFWRQLPHLSWGGPSHG